MLLPFSILLSSGFLIHQSCTCFLVSCCVWSNGSPSRRWTKKGKLDWGICLSGDLLGCILQPEVNTAMKVAMVERLPPNPQQKIHLYTDSWNPWMCPYLKKGFLQMQLRILRWRTGL
jgi:hypothetical protein